MALFVAWSELLSVIKEFFVWHVNFETVQVNGISTLGENIADNGGLRISYDALQTWLSDNHYNDAILPGLNMTHSQQFFLSFAQVCCHCVRMFKTTVVSGLRYLAFEYQHRRAIYSLLSRVCCSEWKMDEPLRDFRWLAELAWVLWQEGHLT